MGGATGAFWRRLNVSRDGLYKTRYGLVSHVSTRRRFMLAGEPRGDGRAFPVLQELFNLIVSLDR
jgi:hypothetical protein